MSYLRFLVIGLLLMLLTSCQLLQSLLYLPQQIIRVPASVIRAAGSSVGFLTDAPAEPVTEMEDMLETHGTVIDPVSTDISAE